MKKNLLEVVHESVKDLYKIGLVDQITMQHFDELCIPPVKKLKPTQIKQIRLKDKLSQPVFAHALNVSPSTVKQWETGSKHPNGAALKLLNIVAKKGINAIML